MSVEFSGYSKSAGQFYPTNRDERCNMHNSGAGKVGEALGLDDVWQGGTMRLAEFERRIFQNADGHPDPYVAEWLIRLAHLVRSTRNNLPTDAVITWG